VIHCFRVKHAEAMRQILYKGSSGSESCTISLECAWVECAWADVMAYDPNAWAGLDARKEMMLMQRQEAHYNRSIVRSTCTGPRGSLRADRCTLLQNLYREDK
jgi:hypothetical protein